ncbi:hypothetical protein V4T45_003980 [Vibrio vulnificus]|nr:hypothetical protein [Vibrio vulnificus]ELR8772611.1 hypothetical protein [Vibrio vulnificus]
MNLNRPTLSLSRILSMHGLFSLLTLSSPVYGSQGNEVCPVSTSPLHVPLLHASCAIGDGLWGNMPPKNEKNLFWVQCGVLPERTKMSDFTALRQVIGDIFNQKGDVGFHCLTGPYENYTKAKAALMKVRGVSGFESSVLRELPTAPPREEYDEQVVGYRVDTKNYHILLPTLQSPAESYLENGVIWGRVSYHNAMRLCSQVGMNLPNDAAWNELELEGVFTKHRFPILVPYWGTEQKAYFVNKPVRELTSFSLINIMCVLKK